MTRPHHTQTPDWSAARHLLSDGGLLSVILPVYNLAGPIAENIRQIAQTFRGAIPFELIAVNDGSADRTGDSLQQALAETPELRILQLAHNQGKGAALRAGFNASHGSHILFLDADLDLPPAQTARFFEIMHTTQADAVIGSKRHPDSIVQYPWHRRLISSLYFFLVKQLLGLPIRDTQTGIKLFKREALSNALPRLLIKRFAFDLELLAVIYQQGFKITEAPVHLHFIARFGCIGINTLYRTGIDTLAIFYRARILKYYPSFEIYPLPDPPPTVSVVVPFSRYTPYVYEMLGGLRSQTIPLLEILLLPDEPCKNPLPERTREIVTGPMRPAAKRNRGIAEARGAIIAFLDDDTTPRPDWLENALGNFSNPATCAVGGPGVNASTDSFLQKIGGDIYASVLCSGPYRYRYVISRFRLVDDYPSCNLLVRKNALEACGGFSTDYWPGEDTVLCLDLIRGGGQIVYDPRVVVEHHRRAVFIPHLRQLSRYALHRGYFMKHFPQTSRRLSYLLPTLFTIGVLTGWLTLFFSPILFCGYLLLLVLYFLVASFCLFSFNPLKLFLRVSGLFTTHLVYGLCCLKGLVVSSLKGDIPHAE